MNLLSNEKRSAFLFTVLYMSEGAPIGFIWWAMPAMLRMEKVPIEEITGLTALLVLPWAFKFLWAPLIDIYSRGKFGVRKWIISMQILMGITLICIIFINPVRDYGLFAVILFIHAVFSSTQDISIDTLCIRNVDEKNFGKINGYMQAGMLTGRSLFGGGIIFASEYIGWNLSVLLLIGFIIIPVLMVFFADEGTAIAEKEHKYSSYLENLKKSFNKKTTWMGVLFALTGAAAFESAGALASPFLVDIEVPKNIIGLFFMIPVPLFMLTGGLISGRVYDRKGKINTVIISIIGFVTAILLLALLSASAIGEIFGYATLVFMAIMYFFIGAFTASSYALFMNLTSRDLGATQFSTYMAATNGCESWSGWAGGRIAGMAGYSVSFAVMSVVSLMSIIILKFMKVVKK